MHKEIEALQRAYDAEIAREREFVHNVLGSLKQNAAARSHLIDQITIAVAQLRTPEPFPPAHDPMHENQNELAHFDWPHPYDGQYGNQSRAGDES